MIFAMPLEIGVREILPKVFFAYKILKSNVGEVYIGDKKKFFLNSTTKNIIYFNKGTALHAKETYKNISKNNYLVDLDEEGPLSLLTNGDFKIKIDSTIINYFTKFFLWGKNDLQRFKKIFKQKQNHYLISGHLKFDLLKFPYNKIYKEEVKKIKKNYRNFVFIPSSFNIDTDSNEKFDEIFRHNMRKHNINYIREDLIRDIKYENNNYLSLLRLVKKIAEDNPNTNFVFRPHPGQNIYKIQKRLIKKLKNLHIVYKYTATPWIMASKLFIHSGSTTSLEAAILKKKIIYYNGSDCLDYTFNKGLENVGNYYTDFAICLNDINKFLQQEKFLKKTQKEKKYLPDVIENSKNNFFSYKILISYFLKLKKKISKQEKKISFNNVEINFFIELKNWFLRKLKFFLHKSYVITYIISSLININFSMSEEKKKNKIKLTEKLIRNYMDFFNKLEKKKIKFSVNLVQDGVIKVKRII
jgi:surface carbohydrate biosynthesis protein